METLVIDSRTPMDALLSFVGAKRLKIFKDRGVGGLFTPVTDECEPVPDTLSIDEICDRLLIDTTGYVFNRDEANNYE